MTTITRHSSITNRDQIEDCENRTKELSLDLAQQLFVELHQDLTRSVKISTSDYIIIYTKDTEVIPTSEVETDIFGFPKFGFPKKRLVSMIRTKVFNRSKMQFEPDENNPITHDMGGFIRQIADNLEKSGCTFERF